MGNYLNTYFLSPDTMPVPDGPPTFDPMLGFPNGRKPRVMIATEEEMMAGKVPLEKRDYCAHKYLELETCKMKHYPFMLRCAHKRHEYAECQFEDYVLRLKEYERERRLLERKKRIQTKAA